MLGSTQSTDPLGGHWGKVACLPTLGRSDANRADPTVLCEGLSVRRCASECNLEKVTTGGKTERFK